MDGGTVYSWLCGTGETFEELLTNLHKAVEARLSIDVGDVGLTDRDRVPEITV